jgi:hypothetical protein
MANNIKIKRDYAKGEKTRFSLRVDYRALNIANLIFIRAAYSRESIPCPKKSHFALVRLSNRTVFYIILLKLNIMSMDL